MKEVHFLDIQWRLSQHGFTEELGMGRERKITAMFDLNNYKNGVASSWWGKQTFERQTQQISFLSNIVIKVIKVHVTFLCHGSLIGVCQSNILPSSRKYVCDEHEFLWFYHFWCMPTVSVYLWKYCWTAHRSFYFILVKISWLMNCHFSQIQCSYFHKY